MTDNERLRLLTDQLEAAKKQAAEKLHHFRAARAEMPSEPHGWERLTVAAFGYASAAETVEELTDKWEQIVAEANRNYMREAAL